MTDMSYFASLLQGKTVYILKAEVDAEISQMASNIHKDKTRNITKRTYEQVKEDCLRVAIEHAFSALVPCSTRNPAEFSFRNEDSYFWDIDVNGIKFELKRHKVTTTYFTYSNRAINTFRKHANKLDYIVAAVIDSETNKEFYKVEFALIAKTSSFEKFFKQSQFKDYNGYYEHSAGVAAGDCIIIGEEYFVHHKKNKGFECYF